MRWWIFSILFLVLVSLQSNAGELIVANGTVCERLSGTYIMRDTGMCGENKIFCQTPIRCNYPNFPSFQYYGMVACRAVPQEENFPLSDSIARNSFHIRTQCPSLQNCALDPNPEFKHENEIADWQHFPGCVICGTGPEGGPPKDDEPQPRGEEHAKAE